MSKTEMGLEIPTSDTFVISIVDPGDTPPPIRNGFADVFRLEFHDRIDHPWEFSLNPVRLMKIWADDAKKVRAYRDNKTYRFPQWIPFSWDMADFLVRHLVSLHERDCPVHIVAHCFAGRSRSGAVALFASELSGIPLDVFPEFFNPSIHHRLRRSWKRLSENSIGGFR